MMLSIQLCRIYESEFHLIQPGTLLAERSIIRPVAVMLLSNAFTHLAAAVVVVNSHFPRTLLCFSGEPWTDDHEICFRKRDSPSHMLE